MIKRLFLIAVMLLIAASASARNMSDNGPIEIETVWIVDMGDLTTGDVVVLKTTSPTYPGREVTSTTTTGLPIYGVLLDNPTAAECIKGTWVRIQTAGYCDFIRVNYQSGNAGQVTAGDQLATGSLPNRAFYQGAPSYAGVTANVVAISTPGLVGYTTAGGICNPVNTAVVGYIRHY